MDMTYCWVSCSHCKFYHYYYGCGNNKINTNIFKCSPHEFDYCKFFEQSEEYDYCGKLEAPQEFCENCCYYLPISKKCIYYKYYKWKYSFKESFRSESYFKCFLYEKKEKKFNLIRLFWDIKEIEYKKIIKNQLNKIKKPIENIYDKFYWHFNMKLYYLERKIKNYFRIC